MMMTTDGQPAEGDLEAQLAEIRARIVNLGEVRSVGPFNFSDLEKAQLCGIAMAYMEDVPSLAATVERLREREAALLAERERLLAVTQSFIAQALTEGDFDDETRCLFCDVHAFDYGDVTHEPTCIVEQARAALAAAETGKE